jgi:hypothetical protein
MESTNLHTLQTVKDLSELKHNHTEHRNSSSSGHTVSIHSSSPSSMSMLLDLERLAITRIKSNNEERVLNSLKDKPPAQISLLEREICIEDICFHSTREKVDDHDH